MTSDELTHDHHDHHDHDHVGAVFADRAAAELAVDALLAIGLGSEHLGVAVRGVDGSTDPSLVFERDADTEFLRDTAQGAAAGGSVGAVAGLVLAGLVVPGIGTVGVGGILALAGASTLWGGTVGAYLGAAAGERSWAAHEDLSYIALDPGEVFVVVCSHGRSDIVHDIIRRFGGRPVTIDRAQLGVPD